MTVDKRAILAANNNADLYEAMFHAHGLAYERAEFAFIATERALPFYAHLTVTAPACVGSISEHLASSPVPKGFALKDSFRELDLDALGFKTLYEAQWIWRDVTTAQRPNDWRIIDRPEDLEAWEQGWNKHSSPTDQRMFPSSLLDRPEVYFLARYKHGKITAGCIANQSPDCVGLSNVFAETESEEKFAEAANAVAAFSPGLPIVGYESGSSLENAKNAKFVALGPLRIALKT